VQVAPGQHERVLDRLLDVAWVVEDPLNSGSKPALVAPDDLCEGIEVAVPRQPDELGVGLRAERHAEIVWGTHRSSLGRHPRDMLEILTRPWVASCAETSGRLSDYVDGELEGRGLARVSRHLARCRRCRALLDSLSGILSQLRAVGEQVPPASPSLVAAVLARIERDPGARAP
jgi:hypothetical protein